MGECISCCKNDSNMSYLKKHHRSSKEVNKKNRKGKRRMPSISKRYTRESINYDELLYAESSLNNKYILLIKSHYVDELIE